MLAIYHPGVDLFMDWIKKKGNWKLMKVSRMDKICEMFIR
jgi:hypothetical protein